jgi:hypothetical protein
LCDLFAAGDVEYDALLGLLVPAIAELGAAGITMRYLGNERIPALLAAHGFARRTEGRAVMVASRNPLMRDAEAWYLTDLDEDT